MAEAKICSGETYIWHENDNDTFWAECATWGDADCGFKVKLVDEGEYLELEDFNITSGQMDKFHKLHIRKRSATKIERGL